MTHLRRVRFGFCGAAALVFSLSGVRSGEAPSGSGRADSIRALCDRLGIGEGAAIADVGCGDGDDSVTFARIVGPGGVVYAEEIEDGKVRATLGRAGKEGLPQITPVLGQPDDPRLPNRALDLIYMHVVYHHFSKPREMLRNFAQDLRPGGYLVIIDREKGPLRQFIPAEQRQKEHRWTGETTVVRQAREAGFEFHDVCDAIWFEKEPFVLVFRRPEEGKEPQAGSGPDPLRSIDTRRFIERLPLRRSPPSCVAVVALDGARGILRDVHEILGVDGRIIDIAIEEWAETETETPPVPADIRVEVARTANGAPKLPDGTVLDAVIFAGAYHRLWDAAPMLGAIKEKLAPGGFVAILDRRGPDDEPRRLAGHRRRIGSELARRELALAGFAVASAEAPIVPAAATSAAPDVVALIARLRSEDEQVLVRETEDAIEIDNGALFARVRRKGYVSGVEAGMLDLRTGARSLGFGLHIMDFLMGPGWGDDGYSRDKKIHGDLPKHIEEGPQICTQARELPATVVRGRDFAAVKLAFTFTEGHCGHGAGSRWEQTLVFPAGKRYILSAEQIACANAVPGLFYRIDMPGHLRHRGGDNFSEIYLSYHGRISAQAFLEDFGPDERFLYRRPSGDADPPLDRFIRAYRTVRDGRPGPWLAGITLDPGRVSEAWCHQRGYVCFIQELWGRDVKVGDRIGAAYAVGFFDSIEEMESLADHYRGKCAIAVTPQGYALE